MNDWNAFIKSVRNCAKIKEGPLESTCKGNEYEEERRNYHEEENGYFGRWNLGAVYITINDHSTRRCHRVR
jgi:hypothetical protein